MLVFISAYRETYGVNDVFIEFIENWKQSLDNHNYVGIPKPIVYSFTRSFCATKKWIKWARLFFQEVLRDN